MSDDVERLTWGFGALVRAGVALDPWPETPWKLDWARDLGLEVQARFEGSSRPVLLGCSECACLFWPDDQGEILYPDRFSMVGVHDGREMTCEELRGEDCGCHEVPRRIDGPAPVDGPAEPEVAAGMGPPPAPWTAVFLLRTGIPGDDQVGSFANATLQTLGRDQLEVSIATHVHVPQDVVDKGEEAVARLLTAVLQPMVSSQVNIEVQIGPFGDGVVVDEEAP